MKALPKKLLTLTLFGIGVTSLFSFQPAQAFTITIEQVGPNVVATGTGAINLAGLSFFNPGSVGTASVWPVTGTISMSSMSGGNADTYIGFTGPSSFGGGDVALANFSSGDVFAFDLDAMFLPSGYVSGNPLSDMAIYFTATFASLGLTPGTYVWTWGTGLENQNVTLQIGPAGVPDGGTTVSLLGCALLGLAALRRKLSC
jgi:protein with PEP-CTERM/exosortase system signal